MVEPEYTFEQLVEMLKDKEIATYVVLKIKLAQPD